MMTPLIPHPIAVQLTDEEMQWLAQTFSRFDGRYPGLEEIWQLMDEAWLAHHCHPAVMDERVAQFYRHPVWLLNWLFIEQHSPSLTHRTVFTEWAADQPIKRVADFGGGGGGLARMLGKACPDVAVEVIEPHPHPAAIALAKATPNVRYQPALSGKYDLIIATDVFEHVPDPLGLLADTAGYLNQNGQYLIANCFAPVILCHLPQTFHFNASWDAALTALGLQPKENVAYGRAYKMTPPMNLPAARLIEEKSIKFYRQYSWLPRLMYQYLWRSQ